MLLLTFTLEQMLPRGRIQHLINIPLVTFVEQLIITLQVFHRRHQRLKHDLLHLRQTCQCLIALRAGITSIPHDRRLCFRTISNFISQLILIPLGDLLLLRHVTGRRAPVFTEYLLLRLIHGSIAVRFPIDLLLRRSHIQNTQEQIVLLVTGTLRSLGFHLTVEISTLTIQPVPLCQLFLTAALLLLCILR